MYISPSKFLKPTELCIIMGKYGSDKGQIDIKSSRHNYTVIYHNLFHSRKDEPLRVFELGLGTNNINIPSNMGLHGKPGASLYGWAEFFKNSLIFGADIDKDILFQTDRIKTFYCDQTNPEIIKNLWNNPELFEDFDIIIEDGLHTFEANVCFLENSIHKLKKNGYFIIEDIKKFDLMAFSNKIEEWKEIYKNFDFKLFKLPSLVNDFDNNILVINKIY